MNSSLEPGANNDRLNNQLLEAVKTGWAPEVRALLTRGADVKAVNESHWTPIHLAAFDGHTSTVCALRDHGADLDAQDRFLMTPLHGAAGYGQLGAVLVLLDAGASTKILNLDGQTPFQVAMEDEIIAAFQAHHAREAMREVAGPAPVVRPL